MYLFLLFLSVFLYFLKKVGVCFLYNAWVFACMLCLFVFGLRVRERDLFVHVVWLCGNMILCIFLFDWLMVCVVCFYVFMWLCACVCVHMCYVFVITCVLMHLLTWLSVGLFVCLMICVSLCLCCVVLCFCVFLFLCFWCCLGFVPFFVCVFVLS